MTTSPVGTAHLDAADKETGAGLGAEMGLSGEEEVDPAPLTWGLPGVGQSQPRGGEVGS